MIRTTVGFFILAIIALVLGAYEVAGLSLDIGKSLMLIFLSLALISFLMTLERGKKNQLLP